MNENAVQTRLNYQLSRWQGTPYRYGGLSPRGVDCSGFVLLTFRDRFDIALPRSTRAQTKIGNRIDPRDLRTEVDTPQGRLLLLS
ncbi:hypothetical protein CRX72_16055 [Pantoea sp. BRM17]|nr:hypothetical protein CRX72_16055 [Pantoea sp. BRM17]